MSCNDSTVFNFRVACLESLEGIEDCNGEQVATFGRVYIDDKGTPHIKHPAHSEFSTNPMFSCWLFGDIVENYNKNNCSSFNGRSISSHQ